MDEFQNKRRKYLDILRRTFDAIEICDIQNEDKRRTILTFGSQLIKLVEHDLELSDQLIKISNLIKELKFYESNNSYRDDYEDDNISASSTSPKVPRNDDLSRSPVDSDDFYGSPIFRRHNDKSAMTKNGVARTISLVAVGDNVYQSGVCQHVQNRYFLRQNSALRIPVKATRHRPRSKCATIMGGIPSDHLLHRTVIIQPESTSPLAPKTTNQKENYRKSLPSLFMQLVHLEKAPTVSSSSSLHSPSSDSGLSSESNSSSGDESRNKRNNDDNKAKSTKTNNNKNNKNVILLKIGGDGDRTKEEFSFNFEAVVPSLDDAKIGSEEKDEIFV